MAHLNYYIDLCVEVFVVNNDSVLLRLHDKYDIWTGPGGHIDPGEDINEAAKREALEESGLAIELVGPPEWVRTDTETNIDLVPPMFMNRHRINETHEHSASIFAATANARDINPQEGEDEGFIFKWMTLDQLDEMEKTDKRLRPEVVRYARTALEWCKK